MANAHVLSIGLVGYMDSQRPVPPELLSQLQQLLHASTEFQHASTHEQLYYQLTHDGAALLFSGDPEAPVRCALELGRALAGQSPPQLSVSMGIHSVPLLPATDAARAHDEALTVAQQLMSRGDAGHILLSATAVDGLSQLGNWTPYLYDLGEFEMATGGRLHLFTLHTIEVGNIALPTKLSATPTIAADQAAMADEAASTAQAETQADGAESPHLQVRQFFRGLLVHSILGEGAMGSAYLASHSVLQMPLVIKTFKHNTGANIFKEAHLAARVTSPHVVGVLDAGYDAGIAFLVQRYVDGIDLGEVSKSLQECGLRIPINMVCRMVIDAAKGLHAIHQAGVIHRDVKPANLFLMGSGTTTVGDFGIALDAAAAAREQGAAGSPLFMSPEQWLQQELTRRADIYALGATAHLLATGEPAFNAQTLDELIRQHLDQPYLPPASDDPSAAYLFSVIARTLRKRPEERFPTAEALARTLKVVVESPPQFICTDTDEARIGHVRVELAAGDITRAECDVIVNAANTQLMMNVGVAAALRRAAGAEIEQRAMAQGPVAMGEVVWTRAGNLHAQWMAHAVAALRGAVCLQRCTLRVLFGAEARQAKVIAFPALGTGVGDVPMDLAAKLMLEAVRTFAAFNPQHVQTVRVVLYNEQALTRWRAIMRSM
ncbi:MAG TPA: serine/threonine-protein kinase [Pyrinomonadaceae bacterium]|nr:serine/threonine-protein kinase [Pyrinomonadaceae bacterium]